MARFSLLFLVTLWTLALSEETDQTRESRSIKRRRCRKYGICPNGFGQGFGQQGYGGFQGGYPQGYPPINIGISQSQSSANAGGGGHGHGYYPNNYQYNGGFGQGYHGQGYPGYFGNGQGAYNNQFNGNYYGPHESYQGGYQGGHQGGHQGYLGGYQGYQGHPGGFGFQGPFGNGFYDEGEKPGVEHSDYHENDIGHQHDQGNLAEAGSFTFAKKASR